MKIKPLSSSTLCLSTTKLSSKAAAPTGTKKAKKATAEEEEEEEEEEESRPSNNNVAQQQKTCILVPTQSATDATATTMSSSFETTTTAATTTPATATAITASATTASTATTAPATPPKNVAPSPSRTTATTTTTKTTLASIAATSYSASTIVTKGAFAKRSPIETRTTAAAAVVSNLPQVLRHIDVRTGINMSLKHANGVHRLHTNERNLGQMFYSKFVINGVQYCRAHLMLYCHICEEDNTFLQQQVNEERSELQLRQGGDPRYNQMAWKWAFKIQHEQRKMRLQAEQIRQRYGGNSGPGQDVRYKQKRREFIAQQQRKERELNTQFFRDVQRTIQRGASQCCYFACTNHLERRTQRDEDSDDATCPTITTETDHSTTTSSEEENSSDNSDQNEGCGEGEGDPTRGTTTEPAKSKSVAIIPKPKLYACSGCHGIVKYCCIEHQRKDWIWEHRGECTRNVPQYVLDKMQSDWRRNVDGDYRLSSP